METNEVHECWFSVVYNKWLTVLILKTRDIEMSDGALITTDCGNARMHCLKCAVKEYVSHLQSRESDSLMWRLSAALVQAVWHRKSVCCFVSISL